MNKKILNIIFLNIFLTLFLISSVSAFMPPTHLYIGEQAVEISPDSTVGKVANEYFDDFMCGNYLTDSSVFYYFQDGFTNIGKEYKATHSTTLCERAVKLATKNNNPRQLAFAYGICSHHVQDAVSHNELIPRVIENTYLPNGLVHVLAEEKVDDALRTPERSARVKSQLRNVCVDHRQFFIEVTEAEGNLKGIDVGRLYDAFIEQVAGSTKYTVGFQSFLAIPTSIHVVLVLVFLLSLLVLAFLIRLKNKNVFNIIAMVLLILLILLIVLAYVLIFTGKLWSFFTYFSYPLSQPLPTGNWENDIQKSIDETVKFFNMGTGYLKTIPDPSGSQALAQADSKGAPVRWVVGGFSLILIALFVWLNLRKRKKNRKKLIS